MPLKKDPNQSELAWYSLSATHQIYLYGLEQTLRIHGFKFTWPYLIIKVLAIQGKNIFQLPGYCTVIFTFTFTFHTNVFGCFHRIIAQFKLKAKVS